MGSILNNPGKCSSYSWKTEWHSGTNGFVQTRVSRSRLFFVFVLAYEQAITRTKQFILECYFVLQIKRPQKAFYEFGQKNIFISPSQQSGMMLTSLGNAMPLPPFYYAHRLAHSFIKRSPSASLHPHQELTKSSNEKPMLVPEASGKPQVWWLWQFLLCVAFFVDNRPFIG